MRVRLGVVVLVALAVALPAAGAGESGAPYYSAASFVNSADNLSAVLAPNTIATLYGESLSWTTKAVSPLDLRGGSLPVVLAGTGVWVLLNNMPAPLYYVSPKQINLLVPGNLTPGPASLRVVRDGWAGPEVRLLLEEAAPALYLLDGRAAIATRADGSVVTSANPARPGEVVVLYATGLGPTKPDFVPGTLPDRAAPLARPNEFRVWLNGSAAPPGSVLYAGVAPGFAGLYQINLALPEGIGASPEIRVSVGAAMSAAGVILPAGP